MGLAIRTEPCIRCQESGGDTSGDNLVVYEDGSTHCFCCGYTTLSDEEKERRGLNKFEWEEWMSSKSPITATQMNEVKEKTGERGYNLRGITDETYSFFKIRFEYDVDNIPTKCYYPVTEGYNPSGYKVRELPKNFKHKYHVGKWGKSSDLFGQWLFKNSNSKTVVLTSGEHCCMAAFQMLENYRKKKYPEYEPTPVVSSLIGENSSKSQIQKHYNWFSRFDKIVVCYDMDEPGREAIKTLVDVLPKGKMYVMELPLKDSNAMLIAGKEKVWLDAYYKAKAYTPAGVIPSSALSDKIREEAVREKIPLPPFLHRLQKMMAGGIPLGRIVNLGGYSGCGKTTYVDELVYFWVLNSPHKVGILSLESDGGNYGTNLLSRHLGRKISLIQNVQEKLDYLNSETVRQKEYELFHKEGGDRRFDLIDEQGCGIQETKKLLENLVVACDCKVLIIDPIQDLLDSLSLEEQNKFMSWQKGMLRRYNITFININHTRKTSGGQQAGSQGAMGSEEDFQGTSAIYKSGACNLIFSRDKEAEDVLERNTTRLKASKIRWTGLGGFVGEYYYDNDTHTLHDKIDWLASNQQGDF